MPNKMEWDKRYLKIVSVVSEWSRDPSTKVGAAIVDQNNNVLIQGCNEFAQGVQNSPILFPERYDRPLKYKLTVHAESNIIAISAKRGTSLSGAKLYCNLFPCIECAKMIIQAGIVEVITYSDMETPNAVEWDFDVAQMMFEEAGVKVTKYDKPK